MPKMKSIQVNEDDHTWLIRNRKAGSVNDVIHELIEQYRKTHSRKLKYTAKDGSGTIWEDELLTEVYNMDGTPAGTLKEFVERCSDVKFEVIES